MVPQRQEASERPAISVRSSRGWAPEKVPQRHRLATARPCEPCKVSEMVEIAAKDGVAYAVRGDVAIALWKDAARVERGRWLFSGIERTAAQLPTFVILQLILPSSTPPDGPMREESVKFVKRLGPRIRRIVTVPLGDALWMNVVRTIMRAMFMLQRSLGTEMLVAADAAAGFKLLREAATPRTPNEEELIADVRALFDALEVAAEARPRV